MGGMQGGNPSGQQFSMNMGSGQPSQMPLQFDQTQPSMPSFESNNKSQAMLQMANNSLNQARMQSNGGIQSNGRAELSTGTFGQPTDTSSGSQMPISQAFMGDNFDLNKFGAQPTAEPRYSQPAPSSMLSSNMGFHSEFMQNEQAKAQQEQSLRMTQMPRMEQQPQSLAMPEVDTNQMNYSNSFSSFQTTGGETQMPQQPAPMSTPQLANLQAMMSQPLSTPQQPPVQQPMQTQQQQNQLLNSNQNPALLQSLALMQMASSATNPPPQSQQPQQNMRNDYSETNSQLNLSLDSIPTQSDANSYAPTPAPIPQQQQPIPNVDIIKSMQDQIAQYQTMIQQLQHQSAPGQTPQVPQMAQVPQMPQQVHQPQAPQVLNHMPQQPPQYSQQMSTPTFVGDEEQEKTEDATAQMVANLLNRQPPQKVDLEGMGMVNLFPDVPLKQHMEEQPIQANYETFSKPQEQEVIEPEYVQEPLVLDTEQDVRQIRQEEPETIELDNDFQKPTKQTPLSYDDDGSKEHDEVACAAPKDFEQLLAEQLEAAGEDPNSIPPPQVDAPKPKKDFLKKNSAKPPTKISRKDSEKKYKYYADNFDENAVSNPKPEKAKKKQPFANTKARMSQKEEDTQETAPQPSKEKKKFLQRGGGKGGGVGKGQERPQTTKNSSPKKGGFKKKLFNSDSESDDEIIEKPMSKRKKSNISARPEKLEMKEENFKYDLEKTSIPKELLEKMPPQARAMVESKLAEVDNQLSKFKHENSQLKAKKGSYEAQLSQLRLDTHEMREERQREESLFDELKTREMRKIKKQRKEFEKEQQDRKLERESQKDKEEAESLRVEIRRLQDGLKNKEKKLDTQQDLDKLEKDNYILSNQITNLEKQRIDLSQAIRNSKKTKQTSAAGSKFGFSGRQDTYKRDEEEEREDSDEPEVPQKRREEVVSPGPEEPEEEYILTLPIEYHNEETENNTLVDQSTGKNGKQINKFASGRKEILFNNGVRKEVWPDGYTIVYFNNNDIKQTFPNDVKVVYFFAEASTTQTTFDNGIKAFRFGNGQIERHFPDGRKIIDFPEGTRKTLDTNGTEESVFADGTVQRVDAEGNKQIDMPTGEKQYIQVDGTCIKEFPDGTVQRIHPDGSVEDLNNQ